MHCRSTVQIERTVVIKLIDVTFSIDFQFDRFHDEIKNLQP